MSMSNVLVTGGAGYIGSHCVRQLLGQGWRAVVLDDFSTGFKDLLISDEWVEGSTLDKRRVKQILRDYDISAVMHFAACAYVGESVENPEKYYENNVQGTLRLLSAMREEGVNQFIFSSSCATYGVPNQLPLTEDHPLNPVNPYGFTKRVVEQMLADFSVAYDLNYVSLRYFNAAGADPGGQLGECHDPETHLIPLILQVATGERENITVFGTDYDTKDGTCVRDYIHINDIGKAHLLALKYLQGGGTSDVFNIGTEVGNTVREVILACEKVTGKSITMVVGERRPGDPPALVASAEKIRRILKWEPEYTDLESIVETAWAWEQKRTQVLSETAG